MTDTASYPLTWELDSLYPNPAQPEFTAILQDCKSALEALVERVAQLADAGNPEQDTALWADFLTDYQADRRTFRTVCVSRMLLCRGCS